MTGGRLPVAPLRRPAPRSVAPAVLAKADSPGTMRCGLCGNRFKDVRKMERHFETLHVREHNKLINRKKSFKGKRRLFSPAEREKNDRFHAVRSHGRLLTVMTISDRLCRPVTP